MQLHVQYNFLFFIGKLNVHERILEDDENPVRIHLNHTSSTDISPSTIQFHLRRRDSFSDTLESDVSSHPVPFLMELPDTSNTSSCPPACHYLLAPSTEIGSQFPAVESDKYICLRYSGICPYHCVITRSHSNVFSIALLDSNAFVKVNGDVVTDTRLLTPGSVLLLGEKQQFRFVVPSSFHVRSNSALHGSTMKHEPFNRKLSKAFSSDDLGHSVHQVCW